MQNLLEHVKLLDTCVSLGNIIAKQRNLTIWSNSTITLHDIDAFKCFLIAPLVPRCIFYHFSTRTQLLYPIYRG